MTAPDPRAAAGSPRYRRALIALFCAAITVFVQIFAPQGLLPVIARDFEVSSSSSSLAIGATTIGLTIGMLPWARLSDRIGRVAVLRWAICSTAAVSLIVPFTQTFEWFIGMRFLAGLMLAGLPAIGVVALSEIVTPLALGGAVGVYLAGNSIGALLGRILATNVGEVFGWQWGLFSVGLISAAAAILFVLLMPPTAVRVGTRLPLFRATLENLRNPGVVVMVLQGMLLMGGLVAAYNYLAFRLQENPFELTLSQISWLFLAYLAGAVASRVVWVFARKFTPIGMLLVSILVMLAGIGITLLPWLAVIIGGLVIFTVGWFGANSIALTLVSARATEGGKSLAPSLYYLAYYAGATFLGWVGGVAYGVMGWFGTSLMIAALVLLSAAIAWIHAARHGGLRGVDA